MPVLLNGSQSSLPPVRRLMFVPSDIFVPACIFMVVGFLNLASMSSYCTFDVTLFFHLIFYLMVCLGGCWDLDLSLPSRWVQAQDGD